MKKQANRLLSALLVLLMLFTMLPVAYAAPSMSIVDASEDIDNWLKDQAQPEEEYDLDVETRETAATDGGFYRILHLDCGRKYFTPAWVKALINEMAAAGYTHLQLAFGNDGLRFLLDDMNLDIDGDGAYEYTTQDVIDGVKDGNSTQNSSGDSRYWTQDEMDDIIAHAQKMGIEIIPLLNLPGHANAILDIPSNDAYNYVYRHYYTSQNTLNIFSSEARSFGMALLEKYVDYFAAKGCEFFNFGADEFANDTDSGVFSFSQLSDSQYTQFVSFINDMAAYIKSKGMKPRAFNDGLYYNYDKSYYSNNSNGQNATIDTDIQCCYWSSGWGTYPVAKSYQISGKGHSMINTHGDFYYVLKDEQDRFREKGDTYALQFDNDVYPGASAGQTANTIGSMFCIWCDLPTKETEQEIAANVRMILRMMAARMQDSNAYDGEDVIVTGGFNADGSLNEDTPVIPVTPAAFPETAGVTESIKVGETAVYTLSAAAEWTSSDETVLKLTEADGVNAGVTASSVKAEALKAGAATVTATLTDGTAIYEAKVTVTSDTKTDPAPDMSGLPDKYKGTETSHTSTGATYYEQINDASEIISGDTYLVANTNSNGTAYVLTSDAGKTNVTISSNRIAGTVSDTEQWILNSASNGYTMQNVSTSQYIYPYATYNKISNNYGRWSDYQLKTSGSAQSVAITGQNAVTISREVKSGSNSTTAYMINSGWRSYNFTASSSSSNLYLFHKVVEPAGTYWTVSVSGLQTLVDEIGTLDESIYTPASWTVFENALNSANEVLNRNAASLKYTSEDDAVAAQSSINSAALDLYNAWQALVQDTTLTIEYWITNSRLSGATSKKDDCTVSSTMEGVATADGVATVDLVDALAEKDGRQQEYWQTRVLDVLKTNSSSSGTELQSKMKGDDETQNGTAFTRVRYWSGKWQIFTTDWVDVNLTTVRAPKSDDAGTSYDRTRHQLVAYYMEVLDIANEEGNSELHANMADWGTKGDGNSSWGYNPESTRCSLSVQVVYEDGINTNPEDTTAAKLRSKTFVYYLDYTKSTGRGIGTLMLSGGEDYQIFKVTAETGDMTSTTSGNYVTITKFDWNEDEEVVWSGDATDSVTLANLASNPSYEAPYDNLAWNKQGYNNNNAILIRVYVKSVPKESSLTVHYIDQTVLSGNEFYTQYIPVKVGTIFDSRFDFDPDYTDIDAALSYNEVTNYYGQPQKVQANLEKLTEIGASYRYGSFKLVNAVRDPGGKDIYLYYTFTNYHVFVVDFGEQLTFSRDDIGVSGNWTKAEVTQGQYGTATIGVNQPVVYTPNKVLQGSDLLIVTLTDEKAATQADKPDAVNYAQHRIYIVPASNVLYEETFFTQTAGGYTNWSQTATAGSAVSQSADQTTLYGYDDIYASGTGNSMRSSYVANLSEGGSTNDLTTTFTGTSFDLIGTCGPDTGYIYLKVMDSEGHGRAAVIDTSYSGEYGTLRQVPLAHLVMGTEDKDYTVTVFGAYRKVKAASSSTASVMRSGAWAADGLDEIYDRIAADGFAADEVEYIYFDASSELAQMDNAVFAAYDMASDAVAPMASTSAGSTVEIDGFRVYRATDSEYYSASEKGMSYTRMLDQVNNDFMAYVEDNNGTWTAGNYEENGGPQNEIYLDHTGAVVLNTAGLDSLQITARVAGGTGPVNLVVNGTMVKAIATATEMYYNIDENLLNKGTLTITTNSEGVLLGLANIKYTGTINAVTQENIDYAIELLSSGVDPVDPGEPVEPEPTAFVPERFDADIHVTRLLFNKYVTITVKASADVAYITVNGERVNPTSSRWFWGTQDTNTFTFRDVLGRNASAVYEVVAYDADGNASEPIILQ